MRKSGTRNKPSDHESGSNRDDARGVAGHIYGRVTTLDWGLQRRREGYMGRETLMREMAARQGLDAASAANRAAEGVRKTVATGHYDDAHRPLDPDAYDTVPQANEAVAQAAADSEVHQEAHEEYRGCVRDHCCALTIGLAVSGVIITAGAILIPLYFLGMLTSRASTDGDAESTSGGDPETPRQPTATPEGKDRIRVRWQAAKNAATYKVLRDGKEIAETNETTHLDTGLAANSKHCYTIRAVNGEKASPPSAEVCATTLAAPPPIPAPPQGLKVAARAEKSLTVTWEPSAGATAHRVRRRLSSEPGEGAVVREAPATEGARYEDKGLQTETQYCYTVSAVNEGGESAPSDFVCANTWTACEEAGAQVVRDINALPETTYWDSLKAWLDTSDPSIDCQLNVILFSHFLADAPAAPLTAEAMDALAASLLEVYESDPDAIALYTAVSQLRSGGSELARKDKLNVLSRVLALILNKG